MIIPAHSRAKGNVEINVGLLRVGMRQWPRYVEEVLRQWPMYFEEALGQYPVFEKKGIDQYPVFTDGIGKCTDTWMLVFYFLI